MRLHWYLNASECENIEPLNLVTIASRPTVPVAHVNILRRFITIIIIVLLSSVCVVFSVILARVRLRYDGLNVKYGTRERGSVSLKEFTQTRWKKKNYIWFNVTYGVRTGSVGSVWKSKFSRTFVVSKIVNQRENALRIENSNNGGFSRFNRFPITNQKNGQYTFYDVFNRLTANDFGST